MRIQIASGRQQLPFDNSFVAVVPGGSNSVARSLYLALQGCNRVGCNLLSAIVGPITIPPAHKLVVTIPPNYKLGGEFWQHYSLSASLTANPADFSQIGLIDAQVPESFMELAADIQFELNASVQDVADLPLAPINGMLRGVLSQSMVLEYRTEQADWFPRLRGFGSNITSLGNLNDYGCDRDLRQIDFNDLPTPDYAADGSSGPPTYFWLRNDEQSVLSSGQRVMLNVSVNGVPRSDLFSGLLRMTFWGYANPSTGNIRTSGLAQFPGIGESVLFENRKNDFFLPEDMAIGEAYTLAVAPNFTAAQLNNRLPNGAVLEVLPYIAAQAGAYDESGESLGDRINNTDDRGVCVPIVGAAVNCLKRSGIVNSRSFKAIAATKIVGFAANTAGQQVRINGNGAVYRGLMALSEAEAIRAIVDCMPGVSLPSNWSPPAVIASSTGLEVTVSYPVVGTSARVREDYPDTVIAGNPSAELNALFVTLYVERGGEIRSFSGLPVLAGPTQVFTLSDWFAGTIITALPVPAATDFCLFEAVSAVAQGSGLGNFDGTVRVAYAYEYDGTTVSRISHSTLEGCLHTAVLNLAEVEQAVRFWAPPKPDVPSARLIPPAELVPWQTRRIVSQADPYYFDPASMGVDNGTNDEKYIRPSHIPPSMPGRLVRDETSVWYGGVTAPDPLLGEPGSYYVDSEGNIYRKGLSAWDFQFRITGTIWDAGTGAPTAAIGEPGDFYVQDSNGTFWQKDAGGVWVEKGTIRVDWFDSNSDPLAASGKIGDYHLNRSSGILFRKTFSGWDQRAQFKGADGNRIFPTNGAPSAATGNDDDWAIDPVSGDLYFKAGGSWSVVGNIKGPQGPQGPQGDPGGGGNGGGSANLNDFVLLNPDGAAPSYSGTAPNGWYGLYFSNQPDPYGGLWLVDDQGNQERIAFETKNNYWEKGQKLKVTTLYGTFDSNTNIREVLIDPTLSNYFKLEMSESDDHVVMIDPNHSISQGENFTLYISPSGSGTLSFSSDFVFAGGPLGVISINDYDGFAVTGISFHTSHFSCTKSAPFES